MSMEAAITEHASMLRTSSSATVSSAAPADWEEMWGRPDAQPSRIEWRQLKTLSGKLASEINLRHAEDIFGPLVGSEDLRKRPVHRWFAYKEGFSPALLANVLEALALKENVHVADAFGGVATTALAGLVHPAVAEVRSVEYSPFTRFVGQTKLQWPVLDPDRLIALLPAALNYDHRREVTVPSLAAFSNREIFKPARIRTLLAVREHLRELDAAESMRDFFLLGLAAVVEDLSGAMKDGRALRIKGDRVRRPSSLASTEPIIAAKGPVKQALAGQWSAMIADLRALAGQRTQALSVRAHHLPGDARDLRLVQLHSGESAFRDDWAQLSLFSPPYLNCVDYTEVYKLELWFLEHVVDQHAFRQMRLGTLRSHPSLRFEDRDAFAGASGPAIDLVEGLSAWMSNYGARPEVGPVVRQYFEDMLEVWREQLRILAPGATAVCVVANSTFSRRELNGNAGRHERWRLPVLTDVILAHLALMAGFRSVEIWQARELRPRNVRGGRARESLVIAHKS